MSKYLVNRFENASRDITSYRAGFPPKLKMERPKRTAEPAGYGYSDEEKDVRVTVGERGVRKSMNVALNWLEVSKRPPKERMPDSVTTCWASGKVT